MSEIAQRVKNIIDQQVEKGISKYGTTLDQNNDSVINRISHLQEELADGLQYAEWIKENIKRIEAEYYNKALEDILVLSQRRFPQSILFNKDIQDLVNGLKIEKQ
jgi:hypothetical protein